MQQAQQSDFWLSALAACLFLIAFVFEILSQPDQLLERKQPLALF
jgi:hypothetical protein